MRLVLTFESAEVCSCALVKIIIVNGGSLPSLTMRLCSANVDTCLNSFVWNQDAAKKAWDATLKWKRLY